MKLRLTHPARIPNTPIGRFYVRCLRSGMTTRQALTACNGRRLAAAHAVR